MPPTNLPLLRPLQRLQDMHDLHLLFANNWNQTARTSVAMLRAILGGCLVLGFGFSWVR